jgi:hypothetical protein
MQEILLPRVDLSFSFAVLGSAAKIGEARVTTRTENDYVDSTGITLNNYDAFYTFNN